MLPATVNAPAEPPAAVLAAYRAHLALTGHGNIAYDRAARAFLRRWPDVQAWAHLPLSRQLTANSATQPFVTFLMVSRRLRPGYDYLLARKLSSFWRDLTGSALQEDLDRFVAAARELGFSQRQASAVASQIIAGLLIQTGRDLDELTEARGRSGPSHGPPYDTECSGPRPDHQPPPDNHPPHRPDRSTVEELADQPPHAAASRRPPLSPDQDRQTSGSTDPGLAAGR